jgi:hypothetical protein
MKITDAEISRMGRVRFLWFLLRSEIGGVVDYLPTIITRGRLFDLNEAEEIRDMAVEALEENAALRSENDRLREALKPFVTFIDAFDAKPLRSIDDKFYGIHSGTEWEAALHFSDFRHARAALNKEGG